VTGVARAEQKAQQLEAKASGWVYGRGGGILAGRVGSFKKVFGL
jgi:hypothetical protein